jgi:hypothetical protein
MSIKYFGTTVNLVQLITADLSYSGSLRLHTLRDQNAALVEKQEHLERQLSEQRHLQEQVMTKLQEQGLLATQSLDATSTQEMGSLIQDSQSQYNFVTKLCTFSKMHLLTNYVYSISKTF